ncbi:MAG: outer membrane lipoprotein-sorting protein [candidate division Zixibacteria bacterium]|nr:outer membrane lipoprotein-sorting protein [candidate division Zixibacteria bacterium]
MDDASRQTRSWRFFWAITNYPKTIILLSIAAIVSISSFLPRLKMDTAVESYLPADHPAVVYRNKVKEMFGLSDPIVIAVINKGPQGVFNPHTLKLIADLTQQIKGIEGVNADRVTSLATEKDIIGTPDGMLVEWFFETPPETQEKADKVREAVQDFALYADNLISKDGTGTYIVVEFLKVEDGERIYQELMTLTQNANVQGEELHVAGTGAVSAYLGAYINQDAQRLNPLCALIISAVLFFAFRTVRGVVLPNLVVMGTVLIAVGAMPLFGISFYSITNALPVILIALGVAYTLHILSQCYEETSRHPEWSQREIVVASMAETWHPVMSTSVTDVAGFMALFATSFMPPMKWFGLFATIGVSIELILALIMLPAILVLMKKRSSRAITPQGVDRFGQFMGKAGMVVYRRAGAIVTSMVVLVVIGCYGAYKLEVNEEWIANFQSDTPIYQADQAINQTLNGTNFMDVVVEASEPEGLFKPENLARIEALQNHLETIPNITVTTSIVDLIKQMNRAMNEDKPEGYAIPATSDEAAQLFFVYEVSGDPTDFQEYIDTGHQLANIRVSSNSGRYSEEKKIVAQAQKYIDEQFNTPELKATLSGKINLDYEWLAGLTSGTFQSAFWSMVGVYLMMAINFRSPMAGLFAAAPIAAAVVLVYAMMGFFNIWLSIITSMTAAITIGVGVDSAIHTVTHLTHLVREKHHTLEEAFMIMYPSTGRALLFSFAGLCLGFSVLITSQVPPLARFGVLAVTGITVSFIASMTFLPALMKVLKPRFLMGTPPEAAPAKTAVLLVAGLLFLGASGAVAQSLPSGDEIARNINARDDGKSLSRKLTMQLIDGKGKSSERVTNGFRKYFGMEKRTVLIYESPQNVKGTGFLVYDYPDPKKADDQWLYLPAMRKVRRISAAERGDYFLGTDFTYEDMKNETKVTIEDYTWKTTGTENVDGNRCYVVEATATSDKVAKELGHAKAIRWVDAKNWVTRKSEFYDAKGVKLKTLLGKDIREVQGIWTMHRMEMENHKTNHKTVFIFSNIDYKAVVKDDEFTEQALRR